MEMPYALSFSGNIGRLIALGIDGYQPVGQSMIKSTDVTMNPGLPGHGTLNKDVRILVGKPGELIKTLRLAAGTGVYIPKDLKIMLDDTHQTIVADGGRRKRTIKKRKLRRSTRKN